MELNAIVEKWFKEECQYNGRVLYVMEQDVWKTWEEFLARQEGDVMAAKSLNMHDFLRLITIGFKLDISGTKPGRRHFFRLRLTRYPEASVDPRRPTVDAWIDDCLILNKAAKTEINILRRSLLFFTGNPMLAEATYTPRRFKAEMKKLFELEQIGSTVYVKGVQAVHFP